MSDDIKIEKDNEESESAAKNVEKKLKKIKEKLKKCQKEKEEYLAGWQRCRADFINARREEEKRRDEFIKFANRSLILDILPVLDSFDLAIKHNDNKSLSASKADKSAGMQGFGLIQNQLKTALKSHGLEEIKAIGEKFNPEFHEAVEEVKSNKKSGIIVEEIQKGYTLHGKVIRPSKVKVSK